MAQEFPSLAYVAGGEGGRWTGRVTPIQTQAHLFELLDDLACDRPVQVTGDAVSHLPGCTASHQHHHWMSNLSGLDRSFEIQIRYDGGRRVPCCWISSPSIPPQKRKHMWVDGRICAFLASEDVWTWDRHTVADAIPYFLIWLVKWMVFDETNLWIGSEHRNEPEYHRQIVGRNDQCWCGSGVKYKRCHLDQDQQNTRSKSKR